MNITVVNPTTKKVKSQRLGQALKLILKTLDNQKIRRKKLLVEKKEIVFIFLSSREMQKINLKFRKKNCPTDVLSFQSGDQLALGELIFCLPVLKKQAKQQAHSVDQELLYMMIHGLLHLLGYDHEKSKAEEKLMFKLQDSCFEQVRHLTQIF